MARGLLRHLASIDGATEVPARWLLGPVGRRKPPHIYSDTKLADLQHGPADLRGTSGGVPTGFPLVTWRHRLNLAFDLSARV